MNIKHYLFISLSLLGMVSCSEADDEELNLGDWQKANETYFEAQYQTHISQTATSFVLPSWSQPSNRPLGEVAHTSCVLVDVISSGYGTLSPYFTDSVKVNYTGRLIPTTDYPYGYIFEKSFLTTYDPVVDVPVTIAVSGSIDGFCTALQQMHRGDKWKVTIPYQMGYGTTEKTNIPAYSTLIYEIELVDFWSKKEGDRYF